MKERMKKSMSNELTQYEKRVREMETYFVETAIAAVSQGIDFPDAFRGHSEYDKPEFRLQFDKIWNSRTDAFRNRQKWNPEGFRQDLKDRYDAEDRERAEEAFYQANKDTFTDPVEKGKTWKQSELPSHLEKYFRRAEQEILGRSRPEPEEPLFHPFISGFSAGVDE